MFLHAFAFTVSCCTVSFHGSQPLRPIDGRTWYGPWRTSRSSLCISVFREAEPLLSRSRQCCWCGGCECRLGSSLIISRSDSRANGAKMIHLCDSSSHFPSCLQCFREWKSWLQWRGPQASLGDQLQQSHQCLAEEPTLATRVGPSVSQRQVVSSVPRWPRKLGVSCREHLVAATQPREVAQHYRLQKPSCPTVLAQRPQDFGEPNP